MTVPIAIKNASPSPGEDVTEVLSILRRAIRRRMRMAGPTPDITPAQMEVLRVAEEQPGVRMGDLAGLLKMAPSTVSSIVAALIAANLVRRDRDERDGRACHLMLTTDAHDRLTAWRSHRKEVVQEAFGKLSPPESHALNAAIPVLARLADLIGPPS